MMKKKKLHADGSKHKNINDVTDNQTDISQHYDNLKDNGNATGDNPEGSAYKSEPLKSDPEVIVASDKDAKKEISTEEKLAEMQDRYLRLSAEFDNYRKRTLREKMELTKNAGENILLSVIPVMDDFERAMKLMETATDITAMKSGIELIYNKFSEFLKQNGIKEIESLNKDFNVDLHDAITKIPAQDESMKGKVVDVVQKGYWLYDKVIRHSKVVVGE
jgi:molecular chaperone GrpE